MLEAFPGFRRRMQWFLDHGSAYGAKVETQTTAAGTRRLLSLVGKDRLRRILEQVLDPERFLSDHGIRSLSRAHRERPFVVPWDGRELRVDYEPGESRTVLFGGNSNWRGPVWFPVNFLLIESLQKFHHFFGDSFTVELPAGSGSEMTLWQVADELSRRLSRLFLAGEDGRRPASGRDEIFRTDAHWKDLVLFHEYFNGDDGTGIGASHQTGWTGLVAKLLQQTGDGGSRRPE